MSSACPWLRLLATGLGSSVRVSIFTDIHRYPLMQIRTVLSCPCLSSVFVLGHATGIYIAAQYRHWDSRLISSARPCSISIPAAGLPQPPQLGTNDSLTSPGQRETRKTSTAVSGERPELPVNPAPVPTGSHNSPCRITLRPFPRRRPPRDTLRGYATATYATLLARMSNLGTVSRSPVRSS